MRILFEFNRFVLFFALFIICFDKIKVLQLFAFLSYFLHRFTSSYIIIHRLIIFFNAPTEINATETKLVKEREREIEKEIFFIIFIFFFIMIIKYLLLSFYTLSNSLRLFFYKVKKSFDC